MVLTTTSLAVIGSAVIGPAHVWPADLHRPFAWDNEVTMEHALFQMVAVIGAVGVAGMMIFQILLALGSPLGHAAFGGEHRVLPVKMRCASAASAVIFLVAFFVILARGGLVWAPSRSSLLAEVGIWVLVVLFGLSTLANFSSRSRWERRIMAPVALVLTVCCLTVALHS